MKAHVLLVDDNALRSANRRHYLVGVGVEVINASEKRQSIEIEVMQSHHVDAVCIDAQSVVNSGSEIGALVKCLRLFVPVVFIADDDRLPGHSKEQVDIVIDRPDFDVTNGRLVQELSRDHVPFFRQWFDKWASRRASESDRGETIHAC